MNDKINFVIPDEVMTQITTKVQEVVTLMKPYLIALTPYERISLPKMSDKTLPFVEKCLDYSVSDPQFAPAFIDRTGLTNDMKLYKQLIPVYRVVQQLAQNLDDTTMEAGAESFVASLAYYNSVKLGAKSSIPGAKPIYEDLHKRFDRSKAAEPAEQPA